MKAVQIVKPEDLRVIDIEKPVIDEKNNVLVKMTAAGICGSDMGIYHGTNAAATYPRIIGHEMVGLSLIHIFIHIGRIAGHHIKRSPGKERPRLLYITCYNIHPFLQMVV